MRVGNLANGCCTISPFLKLTQSDRSVKLTSPGVAVPYYWFAGRLYCGFLPRRSLCVKTAHL